MNYTVKKTTITKTGNPGEPKTFGEVDKVIGKAESFLKDIGVDLSKLDAGQLDESVEITSLGREVTITGAVEKITLNGVTIQVPDEARGKK